MQVSISEFAGEVTDLQIPHIAPVLLPEMLKIMQNPAVSQIFRCYFDYYKLGFVWMREWRLSFKWLHVHDILCDFMSDEA